MPFSHSRKIASTPLINSLLQSPQTLHITALPSTLQLNMASTIPANEPADPIAKGVIPTCKQSFRDLFIWKQRVTVTNDDGETYTEWQNPAPLQNPIKLFAQLSAQNWLFFLVGLSAWTADAFDFHALSIQTVKLAKYYDRSKTDITSAITLTLLLRSVGAAFFGLAGDRYGRKWPMVVNMWILGLLQVRFRYIILRVRLLTLFSDCDYL